MLRLYSAEDLVRCPLDPWGIPDPGPTRLDAERSVQRESGERCRSNGRRICADDGSSSVTDPMVQAMDLILIPGVAFDRECNRVSGAIHALRYELTLSAWSRQSLLRPIFDIIYFDSGACLVEYVPMTRPARSDLLAQSGLRWAARSCPNRTQSQWLRPIFSSTGSYIQRA